MFERPSRRYHDGYVRVLDYEIGDTENTDGHEHTDRVRAVRQRCAAKSLLAFASADTLAMVLDRIGSSLGHRVSAAASTSTSNKPTGETVEVRIVTVVRTSQRTRRQPPRIACRNRCDGLSHVVLVVGASGFRATRLRRQMERIPSCPPIPSHPLAVLWQAARPR